MSERRPRTPLRPIGEDASVTPLELFFDLVFVFALTQVTAFMADHMNPTGLLRGVLIVAVLWWSWTGFAWLDNIVSSADEGLMRAVMFAAMGAMFVLALTIPEAYDDAPGGLDGPVVLALCYFTFRIMHLLLFFLVAGEDPNLRRQLIRFTPSVLGGTLLLLAASQFSGGVQTALWAGALAADYLGTALGGASGWRLASVAHFAERHGLILIVALGESIVAIGVGVAQLPISWPIIVASMLGLMVAAAQWWLYFDVTSLIAERALASAPAGDRTRIARNAYSFGHLPLITGVVLVALGMKKVLEYVGDASEHDLSDPLKGVAVAAIFGGATMYVLALVAFKYVTARLVTWPRLVAAAVLVGAGFVATGVPAMVALAILAAVLIVLVMFEATRFAGVRTDVRQASGHGSEPVGQPHG